MTEKDCDCGEGEDQSFDEFVSALSVDAVAQRNDEIEQLMEEKEEYEEQVDELQEEKEELETQVDELEEELEEFRDAELDELREEIMEITDYWDEEELAEVDDEAELEEKLELAAEFSADEGTVNPDGGEVEEEGITPMRDSYDLSSEGRDVEKFASQ